MILSNGTLNVMSKISSIDLISLRRVERKGAAASPKESAHIIYTTLPAATTAKKKSTGVSAAACGTAAKTAGGARNLDTSQINHFIAINHFKTISNQHDFNPIYSKISHCSVTD